ncbi:MAG: hypothetical protein GY781_17685 [Gammaproteobacteria bacterium]|nr:hypothetical protein [Gammaproteobacteria bacterium]
MSKSNLDKEEISTIIRSKEILKKIGRGSDINIKEICEDIGISRKSAYQYWNRGNGGKEMITEEAKDLEELLEENRLLKEQLRKSELENKGLRISKMVVDEFKKKGLI